MDVFTVSFFGHRRIADPLAIDHKLDILISRLLKEKSYVEFLVGRDGEFDQVVSSSIRRCKQAVCSNNCSHVWVLPYMTADLRDNEESYLAYYDEIEIAAEAYYKSAFQTRNRRMVDRSDLVVFYVDQATGGAYQTMRYAERCKKFVVNLADDFSL